MKSLVIKLLTTLTFATTPAFAHENIEVGPNGGRVFELESKTTPHLEVAEKDGKFVIHVLDAKEKPIPLGDRTLAITAGDRSNPQKLAVDKSADVFTATIPKGEKFPVVFQLREMESATKPLTARLTYNAKPCAECKRPEWLCTCGTKSKK